MFVNNTVSKTPSRSVFVDTTHKDGLQNSTQTLVPQSTLPLVELKLIPSQMRVRIRVPGPWGVFQTKILSIHLTEYCTVDEVLYGRVEGV